MTRLYRIYTEKTEHLPEVIACIDKYLDGYTVIRAAGVWKGQSEKSLIIETISDQPYELFKELAQDIKRINHQASVLLTVQPVDAEFV